MVSSSLSARRAWIEIVDYIIDYVNDAVALRKESVDRNRDVSLDYKEVLVALRKESVDRNFDTMQIVVVVMQSLSARRAWIEIIDDFEQSSTRKVALRKESVDRNNIRITSIDSVSSRSPQGERG